MIVLDMTERRRTERALAESERHRQSVVASMLRSQDAERARIAVELHDDTIQVLTACMLSLDQLTQALQRGDTTSAERSAVATRTILGEATERTRRLTFDMRPQVLQARGLSAAIRDSAERAAERGRLRDRREHPPGALPGDDRDAGLSHRARAAGKRAQARPGPAGARDRDRPW